MSRNKSSISQNQLLVLLSEYENPLALQLRQKVESGKLNVKTALSIYYASYPGDRNSTG